MSANTKALRKRRTGRLAPPGWERVPDFAKRTGFGLNQVYNACNRGELTHIKIGSTILVASDALERRLAETSK
jgi:hypothetical protein